MAIFNCYVSSPEGKRKKNMVRITMFQREINKNTMVIICHLFVIFNSKLLNYQRVITCHNHGTCMDKPQIFGGFCHGFLDDDPHDFRIPVSIAGGYSRVIRI